MKRKINKMFIKTRLRMILSIFTSKNILLFDYDRSAIQCSLHQITKESVSLGLEVFKEASNQLLPNPSLQEIAPKQQGLEMQKKEKKDMRWEIRHEWDLALNHKRALEEEDYKTCLEIQKEVDRRIQNGTLNKHMMNGFKYYNPETGRYEGEPNYKGLNGLFDKYNENKNQ